MPTFENLNINQLSEEATSWFAELLRTIETLDVSAVLDLMSEDITASQDNNVTTEHGRDAIGKTLEAGWTDTKSLFHDELNLYGRDHNFVHEAVTTIEMSDGSSFTANALVAIDRDEQGQMSSWRVYKDPQAGTY
jgi:ketosteroid isomerase-like protein